VTTLLVTHRCVQKACAHACFYAQQKQIFTGFSYLPLYPFLYPISWIRTWLAAGTARGALIRRVFACRAVSARRRARSVGEGTHAAEGAGISATRGEGTHSTGGAICASHEGKGACRAVCAGSSGPLSPSEGTAATSEAPIVECDGREFAFFTILRSRYKASKKM